jgi:crotonobetainyl-CoA:carnitine CoA-transferase CaiB-like acyl-CoA transferase
MRREADAEVPGDVTQLGIPIQYRREPGHLDPRVPQLGQHTHEVLQALGLTPQEVVQASGMPADDAR